MSCFGHLDGGIDACQGRVKISPFFSMPNTIESKIFYAAKWFFFKNKNKFDLNPKIILTPMWGRLWGPPHLPGGERDPWGTRQPRTSRGRFLGRGMRPARKTRSLRKNGQLRRLDPWNNQIKASVMNKRNRGSQRGPFSSFTKLKTRLLTNP